MGLKGYRLWDMGQLDSTCSAPPMCACFTRCFSHPGNFLSRGVAVQVAFETPNFETSFSLDMTCCVKPLSNF
jgi:hypothetical protein